MQGTISESGEIRIRGLHLFNLFVKRPVNDNSEWPFLRMSGSRSEEENDSSFKGANTIKLLCGNEDTASLWYWNRMGPFQA